MFNFRLKVFRSVAINRNFTKAAEELYITQPAVTKNIKELENTLKVTLFERNKSGILLTKAGNILLKYTEEVLELDKKLEFDLGLLRDTLSGNLKIGASTTIGQYVLPAMLAEFRKDHPDTGISLVNNNTLEIENEVISRELDMGIVEGSARKKELKYVPFMNDEIVAIAHTSQPISKTERLTTEELKATPLVLREIGSGSLEVILSKLAESDVKLKDLNILMHLGSTESIKGFLAECDCIGFVSIHAVSREIVKGDFKIIDIDGLEITRTFNFIYPQGQQNGLAETFMGYLKSHKDI